MNINTALPLQARNQMLRGMDWWNFGGADASIAPTWFGLRYARLKVVVLQFVFLSVSALLRLVEKVNKYKTLNRMSKL